jgi:hypothetical protein
MSGESALHCVICFEEFSLKERPPVVLPCGHTYVCLVCSKKIKRCMECREPLFWTPPPPANSNMNKGPTGGAMNNHNFNHNTRYGAGGGAAGVRRGLGSSYQQQQQHHYQSMQQHHHQQPPLFPGKPQEPLPLPVPKNLVLLEQIEAAERQALILKNAAAVAAAAASGPKGTRNKFPTNKEDDDDDEEVDDFSRLATISVTDACGTYAVRDPQGLAVLPFDPNRNHQHLEYNNIHSVNSNNHGDNGNHESDEEDDEEEQNATTITVSKSQDEDEDEVEVQDVTLTHTKKKTKKQSPPTPTEQDDDVEVAPTTTATTMGSAGSQPLPPPQREPFTIEAGCTVQVVSIDDGVYKLARQAGYIVATVNQLVKGTLCVVVACISCFVLFRFFKSAFSLSFIFSPLRGVSPCNARFSSCIDSGRSP